MIADQDPLARVIDAIAVAADAHRHQRRKDADATPYINHPLQLLHILTSEAGIYDPDVLCAAALHDYLEDCCGNSGQSSLEQGRAILQERFGRNVLTYVEAVSDDKTLPKAERKRMQVSHAGHAPHGAKLVKLADKVANLRDISTVPPVDWSLQRRQAYFDWAKEVIEEIRGAHSQLEALFDAEYALRPREAAQPVGADADLAS